MANFGYKPAVPHTSTALGTANNSFGPRLSDASYTDNSLSIEYTPSAAETVTELYIHARDNYGSAGSCKISVYEYSSGLTNLVGSADVTGITSLDWYSTTGLNIALSAGTTYRLVVSNIVDTRLSRTTAFSAGTTRATSNQPDPWVEFGTINNVYQVYAVTAASAISLSGPDTTTENTSTQATGTQLDGATSFSLQTDDTSFSIAQTITSQTATTLDYTATTGASTVALGTPLSGVPLEPTITAIGITSYQLQQVAVDSGGQTERNITINAPATHEVIQTTQIQANTNSGESIFASDIIVVEDNMQAYVPKTANGMNITWLANGTFTTDTDQTETVQIAYFSPATGQWSAVNITILDSTVVPSAGGGGGSSAYYNYLKSQGYSGGMSTARRAFLGKGSQGSGEEYSEYLAAGYDGGLSTARYNFLKDNQ